ncbi:MalY/PatB family protein [Proteiniclasticum sp.]|uniref:MalY/PatB family protein n=1 Tax=Proteiniclasticum sp. TaxID=2053595 RepID=UPI00289CC403|nr:MalY/PatB family protein [Proteiniclasticum sp.]
MKYDFETLVDRYDTGSFKYDQMVKWNPESVSEKIVPLSVADMEFRTPPEIVEALKKYLDRHVLGYTGPTAEYLESVRNWMKKRHGWEIEDTWIVGTPGVVGAFFMAVTALTKPGDGVIVMSPVYYPFYKAVESGERTLVRNELKEVSGRYEIDFEDLEEKARDPKNTALLFCSPHNPVGRVWTREELEKVAEICERNGILVLSDEIHFDLIMPGYRHTVFSSLNEWTESNTVVFTAPSKTFNLAGMQTSNIIIANPKLRRLFIREMNKTAVMNLNALGYEACKTAYNECEDWLEELIEVIHTNHLLVKDYMEVNHPKIRVYDLEGTYLQWMDFRALRLDKTELERILHEEALVFLDEGYFFGETGTGFERINLACPRFVLEDALKRISSVIRKYED